METFQNIAELKHYLSELRSQGKSIGFVPTMGALHPGHISLIERARKDNDIVVCSIFVNPIQFNDKSDLEKYPRTPGPDSAMLEVASCDVLFAPSVQEIYPEPDNRQFNFGDLEKVMEGKHRPRHFNGVAIVVSRLFDIVQPHNAYFGQKDYQQLTIVRKMAKELFPGISIISCTTAREPDGLAMSSRNVRLSPEQRKEAAVIPSTLFKVKEMAASATVKELKSFAVNEIAKSPGVMLEYFEIADKDTLQPLDAIDPGKGAVACIAVKIGSVRLIDNVILFA